MAHNTKRLTRRTTLTFEDVPEDDWSTPQALDYFGNCGRLAYSTLRAAATSTVTQVTLLVYQGDYTAATDPDTVPDENKVFERTGIAITGHATDADDEYNILLEKAGGVYDVTQILEDKQISAESALWCAIKGTAGTDVHDFTWMLSAVDVG